jgi:hypothetical protein
VGLLSGTSILPVTGLSALSEPLVDVVYQGGAYWYAAGAKLYSGSESAAAAVSRETIATVESTASITALAADSSRLYLSSFVATGPTGYIACKSASGWSVTETVYKSETSSTTRSAARVSALVTARDLLIAGTGPFGSSVSSAGYFVAVASDTPDFGWILPDGGLAQNLVVSSTNYDTTLAKKSITMLRLLPGDGTSELLFASVSNGGLWSNTWNGSSWSGWSAE